MSNPPNPLSVYRTYSYHHVLVVCDSTRTAEMLAADTDIEAFHHPAVAQKYTPRPVVEYKHPTQAGMNSSEPVGTNSGETGNYIVLINGMTDSSIFIDDAKWETIITPQAATADGVSQATVVQTEGEITIVEPLGVNFLNLLSHVSAKLNSDPMGLVFLLKTFFVGVRTGTNDKGQATDQHEVISNVRPFMFIPVDITSVFSHEGATYSMQVFGISNGAGHLAPIQNIASDVNLQIQRGQTLKSVMDEFSNQLNLAYENFIRDTQKRLTDANIAFALSDHFRFIYYKIELDPGFNDYEAGNNEVVVTADKIGNPIIPFKSGIGVTEAIDKIMMSCQELVDDKENVTFKITSRIETTKDAYWVIYSVERYVYKTINVKDMLGTGQTKPSPGQSIEFDYIFTGKNIDVIDFDLRMDLGLSFWQMVATAQNIPSQQSAMEGNVQSLGRGMGGLYHASPTNTSRIKTPLFFGSANAEHIINNYRKPTKTLEFRAMINRHAAIENVQCRVKILGNPQLLDEMMVHSHKYAEQAKENQTINPSWTKVPTFVKVNVKAPVDANNLFGVYEPFWYTDYYSLFSISNHFKDGEFTQELDMFALPIEDEAMGLTDTKTPEQITAEAENVRKQDAASLAAYKSNMAETAVIANSNLSGGANNQTTSTQATSATNKTAAQLRDERNAHKYNINNKAGGS